VAEKQACAVERRGGRPFHAAVGLIASWMARYKQVDDIDIPHDFHLPEGNVVRGQLLFKKHCSQCHTIRKDGLNPYGTLFGPNLYGVMGRTAAANQRSGGMKYSQGLEESGILWTDRNMMCFLKNPRAFAGGAINMNFRGMDRFKDRVDLVHYLKKAGHESWMVQDGSPHSQKKWWTREGAQGKTVQYMQVYGDDKQLSPWQRLYRMAKQSVSDTCSDVWARVGRTTPPLGGAHGADSGDEHRASLEDDPEVRKWRQVGKVVDGVKPATMQQSFNWPPREEISQGPVKLEKKTRNSGAARAPPPPPAEDATSSSGFFVPALACEAPPPPAPLEGHGYRAPSGIMVYPEPPAPALRPTAAAASGGPPGKAPPGRPGVAAPQASPPAPAASSQPNIGVPGPLRPDGGWVSLGGLIVYTS